MKDGISPAQLQRYLVMQKQPEYDEKGRCLHVRAHYVSFTMDIGREVCPDCSAIKWGDKWPDNAISHPTGKIE